jgi:hypothetical protein
VQHFCVHPFAAVAAGSYCGKKFLPSKLSVHLRFFCGPDAVKSAALAKQQKKKGQQQRQQQQAAAAADKEDSDQQQEEDQEEEPEQLRAEEPAPGMCIILVLVLVKISWVRSCG